MEAGAIKEEPRRGPAVRAALILRNLRTSGTTVVTELRELRDETVTVDLDAAAHAGCQILVGAHNRAAVGGGAHVILEIARGAGPVEPDVWQMELPASQKLVAELTRPARDASGQEGSLPLVVGIGEIDPTRPPESGARVADALTLRTYAAEFRDATELDRKPAKRCSPDDDRSVPRAYRATTRDGSTVSRKAVELKAAPACYFAIRNMEERERARAKRERVLRTTQIRPLTRTTLLLRFRDPPPAPLPAGGIVLDLAGDD